MRSIAVDSVHPELARYKLDLGSGSTSELGTQRLRLFS